jgi:Ca2+:H+ antiporter
MKQIRFFVTVGTAFVLSGVFHYMGAHIMIQFAFASIAVILIAALLGKATESVAHYAGQRLGGFLNATFGNAAELIIAIFLIREGLFEMVKASITGAIIGNMLLVLGLSVLLGGLKFKEQHFNVRLASHNSSLMLLSVIALFIPAMFFTKLEPTEVQTLSLVVSGILIVSYLLWLYFSMISHREIFGESEEKHSEPLWGKGVSIMLLLAATVLVAIESEWLVAIIEVVADELGWSELFIGAFVIAIIGNAAEHSAAVLLAMKNKMGAAVEIAVGSSLQIALFVAPTLVFISYFFGNPMDIVFTPYEMAAIAVSAFIAKSISQDGATNWYEGVLLLVVYIILGTAFFFV